MPATAEALLVNDNLCQAMSFYAGANLEGKVQFLPGIRTVFCGRNYPVFNVAILEGWQIGTLRQELNAVSQHFRSLRCGYCFWLCHGLVEPRLLAEIKNTILPERGFYRLSEPPGMLLQGMPPVGPRNKRIEFRQVVDAASRTTFCHLTSHIFEIPFGITTAMYGDADAWGEEFEGWVGYCGQQPVTLALLVYSAGAAGLYSIGTLPEYRKRGFGEATVRWCIDRASEHRGQKAFVLQSSDIGFSLYKRLGFNTVTGFSVFKSRESI